MLSSLPIIPVLCPVPHIPYYSRYSVGILGASLVHVHILCCMLCRHWKQEEWGARIYTPHKLDSEIGRNNSCQPKEGVTKLSKQASGRKVSGLELMELRIREKIGNEYGGLARTNWAAIVIQTAYRQYLLKKPYDEICKKRDVLHKVGKRDYATQIEKEIWSGPEISSVY